MSSVKTAFLRRLAVRHNVVYGRHLHVGPGSVVWAPTELKIGHDVYIGKHATIEVDGEIGDGVLIGNAVGIVGRSDHDITQVGTPISRTRWVGDHASNQSHRTVIGTDVWLGYGTIVLSGVVIGDSAIIGAGSLVTQDIPPNTIVIGRPARAVRKRFTQQDYNNHWNLLQANGFRRLAGGE